MEKAQDTGAMGAAVQQLPGGICQRQDLPGPAEKTMRTRPELLFLPGSAWLLPDRGDAGSNRKLEL